MRVVRRAFALLTALAFLAGQASAAAACACPEAHGHEPARPAARNASAHCHGHSHSGGKPADAPGQSPAPSHPCECSPVWVLSESREAVRPLSQREPLRTPPCVLPRARADLAPRSLARPDARFDSGLPRGPGSGAPALLPVLLI